MEELDRITVCPFMLRCYWRLNRHNYIMDYRQASKDIYPSNEIIIYTWLDASLQELMMLLSDAIEPLRNKDSQVSFAMVYPDNKGEFALKPIGQMAVGKPGPDDDKTLGSLKFAIGDFLDICISLPQSESSPRSYMPHNSGRGGYQGRGGGRGGRGGRPF